MSSHDPRYHEDGTPTESGVDARIEAIMKDLASQPPLVPTESGSIRRDQKWRNESDGSTILIETTDDPSAGKERVRVVNIATGRSWTLSRSRLVHDYKLVDEA